ncbi:RNA-directed DNA polymerase [Tanacetum coccineum]
MNHHRKKGIEVPTEREFRGYYALLKLDKHPLYKATKRSSRFGIQKVPKHVEMTFLRRTFAQSRNFENSNISCFNERPYHNIISAPVENEPDSKILSVFLGYIVSSDRIHVDETKVQAVRDWPSPKTLAEARSFHGLATFYRRFMRNSSSIVAPIFNFFELECDACGTGIGAVLSQEGMPVEFHSEKLNKARRSGQLMNTSCMRFSKMAQFIPCKKNKDATHITRKLGTSLNFSSTTHPQTDGQFEVVNPTLGNMIRCLCEEKPKLWDVSLAQAEFAYNSAVHSSTGFSPFEDVYKTSPRHVVDLVNLPVKKNIQANMMVEEKLFQVGDDVMVFLRKERFPVGTYSKLQPKKYGPYKILRKINDNAYVVDLSTTVSISKTFNVSDIYDFHSEDMKEGKDSRTSSSKERGNDEDMINELAEEYMENIKRGRGI